MRYVIILILIILDQLSKYLAVINLKDKESIEVIPDILRFNYVENTGAAFGIMRNSQWIFITVTLVFIVVASIYYEKKVKIQRNKIYNIIYILIIAGAIGNLIDRILNRYVVDFIDFYTINYPVFNVADSFVCIGCVLLGWQILVLDRGK
ncbi:MAG: signal peptidase II [Clostridiales bacterium GWE2_32_10]|nr:MAG: signal peptidase II [Clostridiales bacterium GWE2_32_10]HBY21498.1 signal peptidase II [Clostridiales bacterium]